MKIQSFLYLPSRYFNAYKTRYQTISKISFLRIDFHKLKYCILLHFYNKL